MKEAILICKPSDTAGYTDGQVTKTLASWRMDHHIQREGNDIALQFYGGSTKQLGELK